MQNYKMGYNSGKLDSCASLVNEVLNLNLRFLKNHGTANREQFVDDYRKLIHTWSFQLVVSSLFQCSLININSTVSVVIYSEYFIITRSKQANIVIGIKYAHRVFRKQYNKDNHEYIYMYAEYLLQGPYTSTCSGNTQI